MVHGKNRIGFNLSGLSGKKFKSVNPSTGIEFSEEFYIANEEEILLALEKATVAFNLYSTISGKTRASFLKAISEEIMNLGDILVTTACAETGLPEARIIAERTRTIGHIKMFAELIIEGSWVEASIDTALPDRLPIPKPDIRRMLKPVGPVVVFSASNFPLAYSTAGGDTISALAGGNTVIVKAHPSHPATNLLVGDAINSAALRTGMPDGVFSTLYSDNYDLGLSLIKHALTKSVAFTGSYSGGMALYRAAQAREEPVPVFAEMGSVNPVLLLPGKLKNESFALAKLLAGSITLGAGQFCTNPGLMAAIEGAELDKFLLELSSEINTVNGQTMLNGGILNSYIKKSNKALNTKGVKLIAGTGETRSNNLKAFPFVATVNYSDFIKNPLLHEEIFGPFSLMVICSNLPELESFALLLKGQLTVSVFTDTSDQQFIGKLLHILEGKAGRLIFNGVPTGVEVCPSMHHGGPFPASTDSRFTSVGTEAIKRFVRPVAYQNMAEEFLPDELKSNNPMKIWRRVNGDLSNAPFK